MALRPKTKRRLLILASVAAVVAVVVAAVVVVRSRRHDRDRAALRAAGLAAYAAGDYRAAVRNLDKYLSRGNGSGAPADPDVIFAFAVAKAAVPRPDAAYLLDARDLFARYLELRKGDRDAEHRLLAVYQRLHYPAQTLAMADALLALDRDDPAALAAKATLLFNQNKGVEALSVGRRYNDLVPLDVPAQQRTLELMYRLHLPADQLRGRAEALAAAHPGDPRFDLLRADAAYLTGDTAGTTAWLRTAAARPPPDDAFVLQLAAAFDQMGLWREARGVIESAVNRSGKAADTPLLTDLALRLIEAGHPAEAAARLAPVVTPDPSTADARLLGIDALALTGDFGPPPPDPAAGGPLLAELARRTDDPAAVAWTDLLRAAYSTPSPRAAVPLANTAATLDPQNAVARLLLARAYERLGEPELAIQAYRETAQLAPGWSAPYERAAQLLLDAGQLAAAAAQARAAADRDPDRPDTRDLLFLTAYRQLPRNAPPADAAALRPPPSADPRVRAAAVDLLARAGRTADAAAAAATLLLADPPSPAALYYLAAVDDVDHLGLSDRLAADARVAPPAGPDALFDTAMTLVITGHTADARGRLAAAPRSPANDVDALRVREAISDLGLTDGWRAVADANPNDLAVQRATLASPTAQLDRPLIDRTVDRLRTLTGDDSVDWRLARARWQLDAATPAAADAVAASMAEVTHRLPNSPAPLVLWARALERLGDLPAATAHLRAAAALSPDDAAVAADLARLLVRQGQAADAAALLDRVAALAPPAATVPLARLYFDAGAFAKSRGLLTARPPPNPDPDRDLLLARGDAACGDAPAAAAAFAALLAAPAPSADAVRAAADFHAGRGEGTAARSALARLADAPLPPGGADVVRGQFESQFGDPAAAAAAFAAATAAAPHDARTWLARGGFALRRRDWPTAESVADDAAAAVPADASVAALRQSAHTLAALKPGDDFQPVVDVLAADPTDPAAVAALSAVAGSPDPAAAFAALTALADQDPAALPVQAAVVGRYLSTGDVDPAVAVATRAARARPSDPRAARLVYLADAAGGRWPAALAAAVDWRARSDAAPLAADLAVATAHAHLGQPDLVTAQLSPYVPTAAAAAARALPADPSAETVDLLDAYARSAAAAAPAVAADLYRPLAARSARWRRRWLQTIAATAPDAATAAAAVAAVGPLPTVDDQLAAASAWYTLGTRLSDAAALRRAVAVVAPLTRSAVPPTDAFLLLAACDEQLGDLPAAEAAYRRALTRDADLPGAANNLAWLIVLRHGDPSEARTLSERAVAARPRDAGLRDTLGLIAAAAADWPAAAAQYAAAVELSPTDAAALIGSADVAAHTGHADRAAALLRQADVAVAARDRPLPPPVADQLTRVRAAVGKWPTSADPARKILAAPERTSTP